MKKLTIIFTIGLIGLLMLSASADKRKFKGDLYFKLISSGSYYNADSLVIKLFDNNLDSLMKIEKGKLSEDDLEFVNYYSGRKEYGLIDKPYFDLKVDSTMYSVYTDLDQFNKVKDFSRSELTKANQKVQIELTGKILDLGNVNVISCSTIDRVKLEDGTTYWSK
ncbi:MAG: hypothetical protein IPM74_08515 [Crocinitomicaceae bacterium]|nr:hypothetical protein [Crocinitomicaceae bacterium]